VLGVDASTTLHSPAEPTAGNAHRQLAALLDDIAGTVTDVATATSCCADSSLLRAGMKLTKHERGSTAGGLPKRRVTIEV
jgi:hypothetical protein